MASEYIYKLSHTAANDFDEIITYIEQDLCNPQAARNFGMHLREVLNEACRFPYSGAPVNNEYTSRPGVRFKLVDNYIMFYLPEDDARIIQVLRIVYGKRSLTEILQQLQL